MNVFDKPYFSVRSAFVFALNCVVENCAIEPVIISDGVVLVIIVVFNDVIQKLFIIEFGIVDFEIHWVICYFHSGC